MNLKLHFKHLIVWIINLLYYPNVLGYWSENNTGGYCITNKDCTKYRWIGSKKWNEWNNTPDFPRMHNEYLEVVKRDDLNIFWFVLRNDSKIQTRTYFLSNILKLLIASAHYLFGRIKPQNNKEQK